MPDVPSSRRRVVAAATAFAGAAAIALLGGQTTASGSDGPADFMLRFEPGSFHYVDVKPMQGPDEFRPSPGDSFVLTNKLFRAGERVGTLHATCVVTKRVKNPDKTPIYCSGAYRLRGGSILGAAMLSMSGDRSVIGVTGGTGRYAGASGIAVELATRRDNGLVRFLFE